MGSVKNITKSPKREMLLRFARKKNILPSLLGVATLAYTGTCAFLYMQQRQLIYNPSPEIARFPSDRDYRLPYEDVWIAIAGSNEKIHGWWFPAPALSEPPSLPKEPTLALKSPKTILYLHGTGGNISHNLARIEGLRQLGFSVLAIDYRGYGQSQGNFPSEFQLYQDSQVAWDYLTQVRAVPPQQIIMYGESLGGAIALDLAIKKPDAGGLILQSTFTSMADVVKQPTWAKVIPIDLLLDQRFDSVEKMRSLKLPVLLIHGLKDSGIPANMSQKLYELAPTRKQLFLVPNAEHARIYQPEHSYLQAIQQFFSS
ncbi:alpha/beta hydrolase [Tumidithrix helvetica]|uniref:alpha/beta hydrolase n=1 Tax=Tumidithrix helvetica TaxID=3457545 RepID=UPI003CC60EAA